MASNLICSPGCAQTCHDPVTSVSQVLWSQVCTIIPNNFCCLSPTLLCFVMASIVNKLSLGFYSSSFCKTTSFCSDYEVQVFSPDSTFILNGVTASGILIPILFSNYCLYLCSLSHVPPFWDPVSHSCAHLQCTHFPAFNPQCLHFSAKEILWLTALITLLRRTLTPCPPVYLSYSPGKC